MALLRCLDGVLEVLWLGGLGGGSRGAGFWEVGFESW